MDITSSSFIPQIASKEAELAAMIEQAKSKAAIIREEAQKKAKEMLKQAGVPIEESLVSEGEGCAAQEFEKKRDELLEQTRRDMARLTKRSEKRTKELTTFVYSKVFMKDR